MSELLSVLMERDGLTEDEARDLINETRDAMAEALEAGECPEEVFMEILGLEPDYILDLF